jgi:hypothetical protein
MRRTNSLVLEALARARDQAPLDTTHREQRGQDSRRDASSSRIITTAARTLPLVAFAMAIVLTTYGITRIFDRGSRSSDSACVTSSIRPLVPSNLQGTGEVCTAAAATRARLYAEQLTPGGTYTTVLLYSLDSPAACAMSCLPDPGARALPTRPARVVDTTHADDFGQLRVGQEFVALSVPHGSWARLVLMEVLHGPAPQPLDVALPAVARHRVDRLPEGDAERSVAEAVFHVP